MAEPRAFIRAKTATAGWQPFLPQPDAAPPKVADVFTTIPDFLTIEGPGTAPLRAVIPVAKLCGCASEVMVAVDESGRIYIVSCPDETTAEPYGTVVADVLAASGRLWRMSYDDFSALFKEPLGASLEEYVMPRARADWDYDVFQPAVAACLEKGRFPVVLITARPEGRITEIVGYFHGMNLEAQLAPYSFYDLNGVQVLEPARAGFAAAPAPAAATFRPEPFRPGQLGQRAEAVFGAAPAGPSRSVPASEPESENRPETPAGAQPTEPAKRVARLPGPGTKPGVMAGKRPPPKQDREQS
ncbi:MAG: hypothetical protein ABIK37_04185 [candidate division WOR-3 bacterium]